MTLVKQDSAYLVAIPDLKEKAIRIALLATPLALYLCMAIPATFYWLEHFNSDGVCYLHRAMLLAGGDVRDAVSAYWSPGLILSTAFMLKTGGDPLHIIHWVLLIWGAIYVVAAQSLFKTLPWKIVTSCIVSLHAVRLIGPTITPDVLLGAMMMFYLAALKQKRWWLAGLIAGAGFWGKAYFLPFFIVQFPIILALQRAGWRAFLKGVAGFLIIAGPWVAIVSAHEGHFTFSTAARRNRFMQNVAPADVRGHPPDVSAVPPDPFFSNMEVTDHDAWPAWSPFQNRHYFLHQAAVAVEHARSMILDVWRFDHIGLALLGLIVALALGDDESRSLAISGCIYAGGFLLVVYEVRYILPVLLPIALAICVATAQRVRWRYLSPLMLLAFGVSTAWADYGVLTEKQENLTYRQMAADIQQRGMNERFATNTANRDRAACIAFFLRQKFIAMPPDREVETLQSKLDREKIRYIFYWNDPLYTSSHEWPEVQSKMLLTDGLWIKQFAMHLDSKRRLELYRRVDIR